MKNLSRNTTGEAIRSAWGVIALLFLSTLFACAQQSSSELILPEVARPTFPDYQVTIVDYGAVPDGATLCSDAINQAIAHVSEKGGGTVLIPRGLWLSGPIHLKSKVRLHTERGALVVFSTDYDLYPIIGTSFEGLDTRRCMSPIMGRDLEDVAITGYGIFDGSGEAWRPVKRGKVTQSHWDRLLRISPVLNDRGDIWYPNEGALKGTMGANMNVPGQELTIDDLNQIKGFLRPVMISIANSKRVLFEDVTFQNSPAWCLHPLMCEDVTISRVNIRNPAYSQNGDGMDIESCKNVVVEDCRLDVGDDAICIKSGKDEDGRRRAIPTENVVIRNCVVYHGHGGFTVGSEMSGGVKNIRVEGCTFIGTDVGLRFKSTRGRGGSVENIHISDIYMINIPNDALLFDLYYMSGATERGVTRPVDETTPQFKDIYITNVVCEGAGRAVLLQGLPEMLLSNVQMKDVRINATRGLTCDMATDILMDNVQITATQGPAYNITNTTNIEYRNMEPPTR